MGAGLSVSGRNGVGRPAGSSEVSPLRQRAMSSEGSSAQGRRQRRAVPLGPEPSDKWLQ